MTNRHAIRSLKRTPVFTIAVILSLVLGVGSVAAMFAIVHGVLFAPLPYGEPDRLVSVGLQAAELTRKQLSPAVSFTYQHYAQRLDGVAHYRTGSTNVWTEGDAAESVVATWVSASMIPLLQVPPLLGRSFTAEEELRGGPDAVILSEPEWRSRFGSAPEVIGKTLIVNSVPREIVGVMPADFTFPDAGTRVWLPAKYTDSATVGDFFYSGVARLAPGANAEQAQLELAAILPRIAQLYPHLKSGGSTATWLTEMKPTPVVVPLRDELTGEIAQTLWMLAAAASLVLLVAWANVVNLMLIRADSRQLEHAVREALGASRLRVATHFLSESLVLGTTAGALALLVAYAAVRALVAFGPEEVPRLAELGVGLATTGFVVLVTIVGVIICAAVPALRLRRACLPVNLRDGGRGESVGKSRQGLRATITVLQIALALVVSIGSALLLRTAHRLSEVDPGFDATEVTTLRIVLPFARYHDSATVAFYARLTEFVSQLPSVSAAGLTTKLPLGDGWTLQQSFRIEAEGPTLSLPVTVIDDGYYAAMRIPLVAGRGFQRIDHERGGDIVISQRAATTLFGDASGVTAIGKRLALAPSGPSYTIIGVVGDVRYDDLASEPTAMIYRPQVVPIDPSVEPGPQPAMTLVVRSNGPPRALMPAIRQIVRDIDPSVPIFNVETLSEVVRTSTARLTFTLTLMTAAAAITLVLGTIGLYGVMAYMVALRTREFGIRIALGAEPTAIARLVARRGLLLTASGIVGGLILYAIAAPFLQAFLYGVTTTDPLTLAGATSVLVGTAALASWLPARRAARVEPFEALRAE